MKKNLYLMRHGQTLFNLQKRIQGWSDSPLTQEGKAQAETARAFFESEGIQFDKAYSSTQERASDTLEIVTNFEMPYERLKGIKEWNFGDFEAQPETLNPKHKPGERSYEEAFLPYGGESRVQVGTRMLETIQSILDKESGENFLMVSHGGAMWSMFLNLELEKHPKLEFSNCCILHYQYEDGQFSLLRCINPVTKKIHIRED